MKKRREEREKPPAFIHTQAASISISVTDIAVTFFFYTTKRRVAGGTHDIVNSVMPWFVHTSLVPNPRPLLRPELAKWNVTVLINRDGWKVRRDAEQEIKMSKGVNME